MALPKLFDIEDQRADRGVPFKERCEHFAGHFVGKRNPGQAFRLAFVPDRHMTESAINAEAQRLLRDPKMRRRVQELIDTAAAATVMNIRALLQDYHDIATADPNELASHVIDCCRHCHGVNFAYQWTTPTAYAIECTKVMADNAVLEGKMLKFAKPLPDCAGGFGFDPRNEPNPLCPECFGRGVSHVIVHDTTRLSPAARKLYKGAREKKDGVIEVDMHDQAAARDALMRVAGAFKDAMPLDSPPAGDKDRDAIPGEFTEAEAGKRYLELVVGTK